MVIRDIREARWKMAAGSQKRPDIGQVDFFQDVSGICMI